jgi:hypothetical protein
LWCGEKAMVVIEGYRLALDLLVAVLRNTRNRRIL